MNRVVILSLAISGIVIAVTAEEYDSKKCVIPKHYSEVGCTPIYEEDVSCPIKFDCSNLHERDLQKCYFKGIEYNVNSELRKDPNNPCTVGCRCVNSTNRANIICVDVECPELFQGPLSDPKCFRQFSLDKCCSTNTYCINEAEKPKPTIHECEYDGKTYKEGQVIFPESEPCKKCICQKGFNDSLDGPWCEEISCGIELHYGRQIREGCVPIYYGSSGCCPIDWRCPEKNDMVVISPTATSKNAENKCKFGGLELKVGDKLSSISNKCVECSCSLPPLVTCTHKPHTECKV